MHPVGKGWPVFFKQKFYGEAVLEELFELWWESFDQRSTNKLIPTTDGLTDWLMVSKIDLVSDWLTYTKEGRNVKIIRKYWHF